MEKYKRLFVFISIMVSLPLAFLFVVAIIDSSVSRLFVWGGILLLWWCTCAYLRKGNKFSFWWSFILINLFWWPLLVQTIGRILFVLENGGMDRADGFGSPLAFLIGVIFEQLFFIPLSIAIIGGIFAIKSTNNSLQPSAKGTSRLIQSSD